MKIMLKTYTAHFVFIFLYGVLNFIMLLYKPSFFYIMLFWNVALAFIPLLLSDITSTLFKKNKKNWIVFFVLWFIFLPNTFYMITDFIHIEGNTFIKYLPELRHSQYLTPYRYSTHLFIWIELLTIGLGMIYATFSGLISLAGMQKMVVEHFNKKIVFIFTFITAMLNGLAIYIGRFLRFNSWDIFNLVGFFKKWQSLEHSVGFTLSFIFSVAVYILALNSAYHFILKPRIRH